MSTRFAYIYFMANDPERVRSVAPSHIRHWHDLNLTGYSGGPFVDRSGGLITFEAEDVADAEAAVAGDPFVREGLVDGSWLREWAAVSGEASTAQ